MYDLANHSKPFAFIRFNQSSSSLGKDRGRGTTKYFSVDLQRNVCKRSGQHEREKWTHDFVPKIQVRGKPSNPFHYFHLLPNHVSIFEMEGSPTLQPGCRLSWRDPPWILQCYFFRIHVYVKILIKIRNSRQWHTNRGITSSSKEHPIER